MLHFPTGSVTTASIPDGGHVNDMLTSDRIMSGGAYVAFVGNHLEHIPCGRIRFLFFFSLSGVHFFQDAAVIKVFDWLVVIRQINKFVN